MEDFRTALGRIGFNAPSNQEIIANGFDSISSLATMTDTDITELIKHIGRWKGAPPPAVAGQLAPLVINILFTSVKKLRTMRMWFIVQRCKGIYILTAQYTNEQIKKMVTRNSFLISQHD